ncbi:MAG: hypothetical protein Kow0040_28800 [Thermogutta sp.]
MLDRGLREILLLCAVCAGCTRPWMIDAPPPILTPYYPNPVFVQARDPLILWENLVDVVDNYFEIASESPVRDFGGVVTEGRLETRPKIGATLLEPWHRDSADRYSRLEATLQTVRRRAEIRVSPRDGGYWISVQVFKELEDLAMPSGATASSATFRNDSSLNRVESPIGEAETHAGWIPLGRDTALEQRIVEEIGGRFGVAVPTSESSAIPPQVGT